MDGAASSEGGSLAGELRQALLAARVRDGRGPSALTARQARGSGPAAGPDAWAGTTRPVHCGQACWPISRCGGSTASRTTRSRTDPVAALVLGPPAPLELLLVGGTPVVDGGELRTAYAATAVLEVRRPGFGWSAPS